jgi:hypothetical protein
LAFNLLFLAHLALAGVGAYALARAEGCGSTAALLAGIAFGGLPKLAAHTAAGHLTLVLAVAWTPWLLLAARNAARARSIRGWGLAGLLIGMIFLVDPRWSLPAALAAAAYALVSEGDFRSWKRKEYFSWSARLLVFAGFGLAGAAVLAIPLAQFVSLSTRAGLTAADATVQSLPFISLLGLIFGGLGGSAEWVIYPGVAVVALALFSLPIPVSRRPTPGKNHSGAGSRSGSLPGEGERGGEVWYWLFLFIVCLVLSLGSNIPGLGALENAIPGWNLLRVPPRWMFLAGLALALLAARGFTRLASAADGRGILKKAGFALAAGGLILAVAAGAAGLPAPLWQDGLMWAGLGVILFVGFTPGVWSLSAGSVLIFLAVIDLALADARLIDPHPAPDPAANPAWNDPRLRTDAAAARIYSPSASIPQLVAVRNGWRLLDGVNPLILRSTAAVVSRAAGVPPAGYSVTLPAFGSGNPRIDNQNAQPDLRLLQLLDVGTVAAAFDVSAPGLADRRTPAGLVLYSVPAAGPRAWMADSLAAWDQPRSDGTVRLEYESPNRLRWTASGPGVLIVADAAYPAWRATVDGKAAELKTAGGWWRAVELGAGEHAVEMAYDPILSEIGLAVTILALAVFMGVWRWAR